MTAAGIIQLAFQLLQLVLSNLKANPITDELQTAINGIDAALKELAVVQGTPVTFQQLETLRVQPKW